MDTQRETSDSMIQHHDAVSHTGTAQQLGVSMNSHTSSWKMVFRIHAACLPGWVTDARLFGVMSELGTSLSISDRRTPQRCSLALPAEAAE